MHHLLHCLTMVGALAAVSSAQCFETNFGSLCPRGANPAGLGDDVLFDVQPLNFAFPMGGVAGSYTHAHIQSNGVVFLTNGAPSGATTTGFGSQATMLANLRGTFGDAPRIAPFWRDLDNLAVNGGGVYFNNTQAGRLVVTWANTVQFNTTTPVFTVQAQLFANGKVSFYYSTPTASAQPVLAGISEGNGITVAPGLDLSVPGNATSTRIAYQTFPANSFDLANTCIAFEPNGAGYDVNPGTQAENQNYGDGCYLIATESFYQNFANAAGASGALSGRSLTFTPAAQGYQATWGNGGFIAPTPGATQLVVNDDDEVGVTPSIAMPTPFGFAASLRVHGNAIVSLGAAPQSLPGAPNAYTPTPAALRNAALTAFWSWHDYNTSEVGSGQVTYQEVANGPNTVALITWAGVENWSVPQQANPSTLQFQLDLTTGVVKIVWVNIDNVTTSQYGSGHLIGFSPGGASLDPGSINLATALPLTTRPDLLPLALGASPAPLSTLTQGTLVTYTTSNIPEAVPGSGIYIGANILSLAGVPAPGVELSFLGAPGCFAHVLQIGTIQAMVGPTSTGTVTLAIPAGVPAGTQIFSQSVALVAPFSLPGNLNAYGMTTSNGVRSYISSF